MHGLLFLALLLGIGPAAASRSWSRAEESRQKDDLLQEMEKLRSEVERLRGRVRVLEYEKEVASGGVDADGGQPCVRVDAGSAVTLERMERELNLSSKPGIDIWNISGPDGGSDKYTKWRAEKGGGIMAWGFAVLFIVVFGTAPIIPHLGQGGKFFSKVHAIESTFLYTWLFVGLYLFTQHIHFQSPHFKEVRTLSIEEAVYLVSQIVTTVGYGDITPASPDGQVFVGFFVFMAIMLAGQMISDLTQFFEKHIGDLIAQAEERIELSARALRSFSGSPLNTEAEEEQKAIAEARRRKITVWTAARPMMHSALFFSFFVLVGVTFFMSFPGENKTLKQAVYMALITLSTVGFGAFTPTTHGGMVFGAFWMLFGVASLASLVSSRAAFAMALAKYDEDELEEQEARAREASLRGVQETKFEQKAQDAGGSRHPDSDVIVRPLTKQGEREGTGSTSPKRPEGGGEGQQREPPPGPPV